MSETKSPTFTFVKDGVYYFNRRIPLELLCHYSSPRIAYSLRTKLEKIAETRARRAADQLDEYWYHQRSHGDQLPGKHMLRLQSIVSVSSERDPVLASPYSVCCLRLSPFLLSLMARDAPRPSKEQLNEPVATSWTCAVTSTSIPIQSLMQTPFAML